MGGTHSRCWSHVAWLAFCSRSGRARAHVALPCCTVLLRRGGHTCACVLQVPATLGHETVYTYVDVGDAACAIICALRRGRPGARYLVGNQRLTTGGWVGGRGQGCMHACGGSKGGRGHGLRQNGGLGD